MANANKRYYWIQLAQDFFKSKEMKLLRKIAGGDTHTIIYLKMMLLSLEDNGILFFDGVADNLAEEIALVIDEDVENVKITLVFLQSKKLLSKISDREYFLEQVPEMVGSETASARRVRKHRESQKVLQSNSDVTKRNGEKEREQEKDIDINLSSSSCINNSDYSLKQLFKDFEAGFGRLLSPFEIEDIQKFVTEEELSPELVREALKEGVFRGKPVWNYIKAILRNWKNDRLLTVELVRARQQEQELPKNVEVSPEFLEAMDLWKD
ncbi:TPA: phage replisome organizer N-terminal domain-containing protein [Streptococcus suis]